MKKVKYTIIHNPRCGKSRNALAALVEAGREPEIRLYLNDVLNAEELKNLLKKLKLDPIDIIRKTENDYKENYKGKSLNNEQWIEAMISYPKLIQRPIIIKGEKAIIARTPEAISSIL
jgi:arsenate reductase